MATDRNAAERPTLHLVSQAEDKDPNPDGGDPAASQATPPTSPLEEARAILAAIDPVTYHKTLSGLARQGHHSVLQALPYTPAL